MRAVEERAAAAYRERFGTAPEVVASAPGRVNLIGEHTDYNAGFVLPCAIDRRVAVAAGRGAGGLFAADFAELRPLAGQDGSWADYPRGVAWALGEAGQTLGPFQAAVAGEVPRGAGLSSSAALEAATALALDALFGLGLPRPELARLCQRAENAFVGVACGIMDQFTALLAQAGTALLLDCRSLQAEPVPLDLDPARLALVVCDTGVERRLAESGYNARRASCARAATQLGVAALRDATEADLARLEGEELRRARHVVRENGRVLAAVAALRRGAYETFGRLLYASHESLRADYEVSTAELDAFVGVAAEVGALGARLTGAGFGGAALALLAEGAVETLVAATRARFAERGFRAPRFLRVWPGPGGEVVA